MVICSERDVLEMSDKTDAPWRDESLLRKKYHGEDLSSREVADCFSCSKDTVLKWLEKHGIEKKLSPKEKGRPWHSKERLKNLYHEQEKSSVEIARKFDCTKACILKWLDIHNIETRKNPNQKMGSYYTDKNGYEIFETKIGEKNEQVCIHKLVAVAEHGYDAVDKNVVHHKNEVPWDNRPENLEPMSRSYHNSVHSKHDEYPWRDKEKLQEALKGTTQNRLADEWGINQSMISRWLKRHGLRD